MWSERETEVEDGTKIFGLSNWVPQTDMGTLRKERALEGRNHEQAGGSGLCVLTRGEAERTTQRTSELTWFSALGTNSASVKMSLKRVSYLLEKPERKNHSGSHRLLNLTSHQALQ